MRSRVAVLMGLTLSVGVGGVADAATRWSAPLPRPLAGRPAFMAIGDFNGDRVPDVAASYRVGSAGRLQLLYGKDDGSFRAGPTRTFSGAPALQAGDLTGDGVSELLVYDQATWKTLDARDLGGALRTTPARTQPLLGNFDADSRIDVAFVDGSRVLVAPGNGDGTFGAPHQVGVASPYPGTDQQPSLGHGVVGDVNGDQRADIVVSRGFGPAFGLGMQTVAVFLGNGDGTFQPERVVDLASQLTDAGGLVPQIGLADVTGDGRVDLLGILDGIVVAPGNGDGTFGTGRRTVTSPPPTAAYVTGFATGDLNGDGVSDVAYSRNGTRSIELRLSGQGPTGVVGIGDAMGFSANPVAIADLQGDGRPDLVAMTSRRYVTSVLRTPTAPALANPIIDAGGRLFDVRSIPRGRSAKVWFNLATAANVEVTLQRNQRLVRRRVTRMPTGGVASVDLRTQTLGRGEYTVTLRASNARGRSSLTRVALTVR